VPPDALKWIRLFHRLKANLCQYIRGFSRFTKPIYEVFVIVLGSLVLSTPKAEVPGSIPGKRTNLSKKKPA
jgi:hypothetical protein